MSKQFFRFVHFNHFAQKEVRRIVGNSERLLHIVSYHNYRHIDDLCSVWIPKDICLYCKTIWLNKKDDKHITLDESKYVAYKNEKNVQHISISLSDLINQQKNNK